MARGLYVSVAVVGSPSFSNEFIKLFVCNSNPTRASHPLSAFAESATSYFKFARGIGASETVILIFLNLVDCENCKFIFAELLHSLNLRTSHAVMLMAS